MLIFANQSLQQFCPVSKILGALALLFYVSCCNPEHLTSPTDEKKLLSTAPTMELDFTQKPERKTQSPAPQKQENLSEFGQKGESPLITLISVEVV